MVAQDIVRFMQNIDKEIEQEMTNTWDAPESPVQNKFSISQSKPNFSGYSSPTDGLDFPLFSSQVEIGKST